MRFIAKESKKLNGEPLVSVIIPTHNRERTILSSVESVLRQSYRNIEVLVIDNGSTDGTKDILEKLNDPRVSYYYQSDAGACAARNRGVRLAHGEYVAFQDSDDIWLPKKLQIQMDAIRRTGADAVTCKLNMIENGKVIFQPPEFLSEGFVLPTMCCFGVSTQTLLGHRELFLEIPFDEQMPRLQDFELVLRLVQSKRLYCVEKELVNRYASEDSISANPWKLLTAVGLIMKKNPGFAERYPQSLNEIVDTLLVFFDQLYSEGNTEQLYRAYNTCKQQIIPFLSEETLQQYGLDAFLKEDFTGFLSEQLAHERITNKKLLEQTVPKTSLSYRVGRVVCFLPRKLRDLLRRGSHL